MKARNGFVSNSSSSSFIISGDADAELVIRRAIKDLARITISSVEELDAKITGMTEWWDESERQELYDRLRRVVQQGKTIYYVHVSNEDYDGMSNLLYNDGNSILGEQEGLEIISS